MGNGELMKVLNAQTEKYRNLLTEVSKVQRQLEPADFAKEAHEEEEFNFKLSNSGHGKNKDLQEELELNIGYANDLEKVLMTLPQSGTAYTKVLKEWRAEKLKINDIDDQITQKNDELAKEAKKQADEKLKKEKEVNDAIEKQFEASNKALKERAEKLTEAFQSPLDRFKKELSELNDLQSSVSADVYTKALDKAKQEYFDATKDTTNHKFGAESINTHLISISGLQKNADKNKGQIEEQKKANKFLEQIVANTNQDMTATF